MNDAHDIAETGLPMAIPPELDLLRGVFAFLDASLTECLLRATTAEDFGIGRPAPMPPQTSSWQHVMNWKLKPPGDQFFMGYVVEDNEMLVSRRIQIMG